MIFIEVRKTPADRAMLLIEILLVGDTAKSQKNQLTEFSH